MATPVDEVIEAVEGLIGYEPPHARDFAETVEAYSRLGAKLNRALNALAQRADENRSVHVQTSIDLAGMARTAMALYEEGQTAHHNFWDNHKFWLERNDD